MPRPTSCTQRGTGTARQISIGKDLSFPCAEGIFPTEKVKIPAKKVSSVVKNLSFSVKELNSFTKKLTFSVRNLSFFTKKVSSSVKELSFSVKELSFSVKKLIFSVRLSGGPVKKSRFLGAKAAFGANPVLSLGPKRARAGQGLRSTRHRSTFASPAPPPAARTDAFGQK